MYMSPMRVNEIQKHDDVCGSEGKPPCILKFGTEVKRSASRSDRFTPGERAPAVLRLGGPRGPSGCCRENPLGQKIFLSVFSTSPVRTG
jgi:hypothetical protein